MTAISRIGPDVGAVSVAQSILANGARRLLGLERLDLAQALCDLALSEDERNADIQSVAANILDRQSDWQNSLACLRRAYALAPQAPQVRLNLAMALLRRGDYSEGFALYEARVEKPSWSGFATSDSRAALRHLMLRPGQSVEGKRVLVLAEQGLGDGIMFARYIASLIERGARVAVACNPTMRPFFARVAGIETLLAPPADQPLAQINLAALPLDAWIPLLSLASWFGTDVASVPAETPYWTPDPERVAYWRRRLAGMGRAGAAKVGLVFQANPGGAAFGEKSMTVDEVLPLSALAGIDVVNLQHGTAGRDLAKAVPGVIDPFPEQVPLDEYAAAIAATDLLISVDTMAAHCAGAMGRPTWLAVPQSPHWAWGLDHETTPWYRSIKIFRQAQRRDWSSAIAALTAQLRARFPAAQFPEVPSLQALVNVELPATAPQREPPSQHRADDRQAAQALAAVAQALQDCGRDDLARTVAALFARLDDAGESSRHVRDAMGDALERSDLDAAPDQRPETAAGGTGHVRFELACAQLLRGEFEQGFANYEARRELPLWFEQALPIPGSLAALASRSLEPGDAVNGRRIVVFTEQGVGDTFFGARCLAMLAERGARITLVCRAPMRPFFARLDFLEAILSPPQDEPSAKINLGRLAFDAFCPLLSLPFVLGIASPEDARKPPYLAVDPAQTAAWRARYRREGRPGCRKVGLVWQANPSNRALSGRSLDLADLAPLAGLDDVDWVNLQDGDAGRGLQAALPNLIDVTREPLPLDEFAAALAATDLVVSVDTMAAHCAGALGHPVWVALSSEPAWYWGAERSDCGWYPAARLFRRGARTGWDEVIAAIAAELSAARCAEPSKTESNPVAED
jgi:ADP-heptose:LPS heptosyltransferase